jgi:hypothetical protein
VSLAGGHVVHRRPDLPRGSVVAPAMVDDPHALGPGEKVVVLRSLRDDPLAALHSSRQIDEAQFKAGRTWQKAYELSEVGGVRSVDWSRDWVDCIGRQQTSGGDGQSRALASLARASAALGLEGEAIVRDVLGARMTFAVAAAKRGLTSEAERKYIGRRFRECLETLAVLYGYAMPRR